MILGPTKMKGSLIILMTLIITITCDRARVDPRYAIEDAIAASAVGKLDFIEGLVGRIDAGDARAVGRIDAREGSVGRIDAGDASAISRMNAGIEGTLIKNL